MSYKESIDKITEMTYDKIFKPTPSENTLNRSNVKECGNCVYYNKASEYCTYNMRYHDSDDKCVAHQKTISNFKTY
jgi:hypothetical protein